MKAAPATVSDPQWDPFDDREVAPFALPELPYAIDALAPAIGARTLEVHHGRHHRAYIEKTNELVPDAGFDGRPLVEIVRATAGRDGNKALFRNAAQAWNHRFFWHSMSPTGGGGPSGELAAAIKSDFGSFEALLRALRDAAIGRFGSGWVWLVVDGGRLAVVATGNADTPLSGPALPLITLDVWEHAYYLDYQNRRPDYVEAWLGRLANWSFAAENFARARRSAI